MGLWSATQSELKEKLVPGPQLWPLLIPHPQPFPPNPALGPTVEPARFTGVKAAAFGRGGGRVIKQSLGLLPSGTLTSDPVGAGRSLLERQTLSLHGE